MKEHVETGQVGAWIHLHPRYVVDRQPTLRDHLDDLGDPDRSTIAVVERASRFEATRKHGEAGRPHQQAVRIIERTVDEDRALPRRPSPRSR